MPGIANVLGTLAQNRETRALRREDKRRWDDDYNLRDRAGMLNERIQGFNEKEGDRRFGLDERAQGSQEDQFTRGLDWEQEYGQGYLGALNRREDVPWQETSLMKQAVNQGILEMARELTGKGNAPEEALNQAMEFFGVPAVEQEQLYNTLLRILSGPGTPEAQPKGASMIQSLIQAMSRRGAGMGGTNMQRPMGRGISNRPVPGAAAVKARFNPVQPVGVSSGYRPLPAPADTSGAAGPSAMARPGIGTGGAGSLGAASSILGKRNLKRGYLLG